MELAPFIIGVGKILTNETPEGFVVLVAGKNRDEIAHVDGHLHGEVKKSATRTFASMPLTNAERQARWRAATPMQRRPASARLPA
jgi:hypothetical protein